MGAVALIVPGDLDARTGGYEYDRRIAEGLRRLGWTVDVRRLEGEFPCPTVGALGLAGRALSALPDDSLVVIDGLAFAAMPDVVAPHAARLRLVAIVHHPLALEGGFDAKTAARLETSERRALASARLVLVTSRATAANLSRYGVAPDRIAVVEPGTDRAPLARGSGGASAHLLSVAAVIARKGHDVLLKALAAISGSGWRLTCVGSLERDGAAVGKVRGIIDAHRLGDRVALVGERDAAGVAEAYDGADVFVLPTLHEGYGMAVAEALARGLPVVSTPTGAIADLLAPAGGPHDSEDRAAGLLVPAGDVEALAVALRRVIDSRDLRDRLAAGARLVRSRLPAWEDQAARMAEVLSRV